MKQHIAAMRIYQALRHCPSRYGIVHSRLIMADLLQVRSSAVSDLLDCQKHDCWGTH